MTFIATAGWSVPRQHASLAAGEGTGLQKYASVLNAVEINSTFYRRHQVKTFERWRASVPKAFRFAVKLPRWITHDAALASPREALTQFFDDVRGLGEKLGPILVQLPPSSEFSARRAAAFFRTLRTFHVGPVACEPRHPSWYGPQASAIFTEHAVARVVADPPRPEQAGSPGGTDSLLYVRWHGSPHLYWSAYGDDRLQALADLVGRAPPRGDVWCVFDNTASGSALHDASRFARMLAQQGNTSSAAKSGRLTAV